MIYTIYKTYHTHINVRIQIHTYIHTQDIAYANANATNENEAHGEPQGCVLHPLLSLMFWLDGLMVVVCVVLCSWFCMNVACVCLGELAVERH